MNINAHVALRSIQTCCVIRFKDKKHDESAPPHYYICLPVVSSNLIICILTSQYEKKLFRYQRIKPEANESLVRLDIGAFDFIIKETAIDCNMAEVFSIDELTRRIDPKHSLNFAATEVPSEIQEKVVAAIIASPFTSPALKELLWKP